GGAMFDCRIHIQPLRGGLLANHDYVDVIAAAQAMVSDGEERVRIRRQVDSDDLGLLVHDMIDEAGILMTEPVVVLPPDMGGEQVIQRSDWPAPRDVPRHL